MNNDDNTLLLFRLRAGMRYTRYSCSPMRARLALDKCIQAVDEEHAVQQAALCLHRDLEELLAHINCINVDQVRLEIETIERIEASPTAQTNEPWNPTLFAHTQAIPPHIVVLNRTQVDNKHSYRSKQ